MWAVARGSSVGGRMPRASESSCMAAMKRSVRSEKGSPRSLARLMILSSISVMLRT